jgi:hypothetical protein
LISVPLTVTARNEASAIGACLKSLLASARHAEHHVGVRIEPWVVLDDCTDATETIARARGVTCVSSSGGKLEAQRRGLRPGPFQIFSDADVTMTEETLSAICQAMLGDPNLEVAFPPKLPLFPRRRTPLAHALHVYNLRRGFSSQRSWFSGKLFAIRRWRAPAPVEIATRAAALGDSAFYDYAAPLTVDDVFLSRSVVHEHGPHALRETEHGLVYFRAPETWLGMYRYYRRMRRELERLDALFPETRATHRRYGTRRPDLLRTATLRERAAWWTFESALSFCRAAYVGERFYRERLGGAHLDPWAPIAETKEL